MVSVPFQNTIRSLLTVFAVSQRDEFLAAIGRADLAPKAAAAQYDAYRVVLEQVLELDDKEFEILVGHLLTALGFEGSEGASGSSTAASSLICSSSTGPTSRPSSASGWG